MSTKQFYRIRVEYTKEEQEKIEYAKRSIWNEVTKIIIMSVLFAFLGLYKEYIALLVSFLMLRIWIGGIHRETYLSCLLESFCWLLFGILIAKYLCAITHPVVVGVLTIALLCCQQPVQSSKRKTMTKSISSQRKLIGILIAIVCVLISCISSISAEIRMIMICGQLIETLQVTIKNLERREIRWFKS